jgi:3-oxoacyl-[acyl-carrier protein] reductase
MRNVIVTGASRGLGLAIAQRLAETGYRVIAVARGESEPLRALATASPGSLAGRLDFRACDLSRIDAIAPFVAELRKEFGQFYGLINNAGAGTAGVLTLMREGDRSRLVELNLLSPMVLTKHVLRSMMVARAGRVINVASVVAATGYSALSVYAATKAGLVGFTRSLAREVGPLSITVNALAPGFVATDMTHELGEEQRERIVRRSALRRMPESQDIAAAAAFLLSDEARNITGVTLTVDAGNTA